MYNLLRISRSNNYRTIINVTKTLSTEVQTADQEPLNVSTRVIKKKPSKPPFMKNVFLGNFDTDSLGFPEVLNKDELNNVLKLVTQINSIYAADDTTNEQDISIIKQRLKNQNVYGLQASKMVDGLELNETENARVLETISQHPSLGLSITNHQYFGVNAISQKGSEKVLNKYLLNLSKGDSIAAFCFLEENNPDILTMKTKAELSEDGKNWILNGTKSWVVNGNEGDVYIVVANTHGDELRDQDNLSVFVVEKTFDGIITSPCETSGFKGCDICNVSFNNTPVPIENVLGEPGNSMKVIQPLLSGIRLSTGSGCIAILQKLIHEFSQYAIQTKHGQKYLCDTDVIRDKIAKININLYAIESITYFTTGLLDKYEKQDCDLESAIVKVFSSEKCLESVQYCMKLTGSAAFMNDHWLNSLYNDALGQVLWNETNDSLRIVIALLGLQYTGMELQGSVKKLRNPFFFPAFVIQKMFSQRRHAADDPKLNLVLENYVHPSLTLGARWLEYCVFRLQYATETMLIRHGPEVMNQHMELMKLANVAIDVYAMTAVLSRASRSYCIGLQNADAELLLASAFCLDARDRVKQNVLEISRGPFGTNDGNFQEIAKRALKFDGYFAQHTLTKNF